MNILQASPAAVKVCVALQHLRDRHGRDPFPADIVTLSGLTGLSNPTVIRTRHELISMRLLEAAGAAGYYSFPAETEARRPSLDGVKILDTRDCPPRTVLKNEERGGSSSVVGKKNGSRRAVRSIKNLDAAVLNERRAFVVRACERLGTVHNPSYRQYAMAKATRQLKDGHTLDELMEVVDWARREWDAGRRHRSLRNLMYLWGVTQFPVLLSEARAPAVRPEYRIMPPGVERDAWDADLDDRMRKKGLIP